MDRILVISPVQPVFGFGLMLKIISLNCHELCAYFSQDTAVTAVFSLLFFIASCAWSAGVNDVKYWTNFNKIQDRFYESTCVEPVVCKTTESGGYAGLNVSLVSTFRESLKYILLAEVLSWWGKMWNLGSFFLGNFGIWREILSFCTLKCITNCRKIGQLPGK